VELVETFGEYAAEYAAIRKGVGILDAPHRAVIQLTGEDRIDLLHRFLTNEVNGLEPGQSVRGFLLNNKGRILADLRVIVRAEDTLLLLDAADAAIVAQEFENLLFTEDVQIVDRGAEWSVLELHGPASLKLLQEATQNEAFTGLLDGQHIEHDMSESSCTALRNDQCGAPGISLILQRDVLSRVYESLTELCGGVVPNVAADAPDGGAKRRFRGGRGIGWLAYNTARIEAGTPLFHVDFGPDSVPHETSLVEQTVSFTKGCYRGQEVVARIEHLGKPKKILVGLRLPDDKMPIAGSQVFLATEDGSPGNVIGGITSSTLSPMLGERAIALAVVKQGQQEHGTELLVPAEGEMVTATVGPLRALP